MQEKKVRDIVQEKVPITDLCYVTHSLTHSLTGDWNSLTHSLGLESRNLVKKMFLATFF